MHLDVLKVDGGVTANELLHADPGRHPRRRGEQARWWPRRPRSGPRTPPVWRVGFWSSTDELRENWHEDRALGAADRRPSSATPGYAGWTEGRRADPRLGRRRLSRATQDVCVGSLAERRHLVRTSMHRDLPAQPRCRERVAAPAGDRGARRPGHRRRRDRRRLRAGRGDPRAEGRAGRGPRLRRRHLAAVRPSCSTAACATSSSSNFHLVFEALKERRLALETLCPHLAKPVQFIYPLQQDGHRPRRTPGLGIGVYDVMGAGRGVPLHLRHLSRKKTLRVVPVGQPGRADRARSPFYEGQVDDARHTMMMARTAAHYGALVASSTRVIGFLREADRVTGVQVARPRDRRTSSRSAPSRPSTPPGCGSTRSRRWSAAAASSGSGRPRASTSSCPRNRINSAHRADHPHREEPALHRPLGQPLDRRHHRHRLGPRPRPPGGEPGRHRLPARATPTRCWPTRSPATTWSGSTPGCGRCWPASPTRPPSCPASTPSPRRSAG